MQANDSKQLRLMQISREFIPLGGKQNPKSAKPAFSRPPSPPAPAPRPSPRPRRCPCSPGGAVRRLLFLSLQSMAVSASTDIAVRGQRVPNAACGDTVRQAPASCERGRPASRPWRPAGPAGARGGKRAAGGAFARSANAEPLPAGLCWMDFFLSVPLPDSFVARNAENPVHYRLPSVLSRDLGFLWRGATAPLHIHTPSSDAALSRKDTLDSVNNVSKCTRQKVVALNNSFHTTSVSHFHF